MDTLQLGSAIPAIGAEPGDWLVPVDDPSAPLRLVRAIPPQQIAALRGKVAGLEALLHELPATPAPPIGTPALRLVRDDDSARKGEGDDA